MDRIESWTQVSEAKNASTVQQFYQHPETKLNKNRTKRILSANSINYVSSTTTTVAAARHSTYSGHYKKSHPFLMFCLVVCIFIGGKWMIESGTLGEIFEEIVFSMEDYFNRDSDPKSKYNYQSIFEGNKIDKAKPKQAEKQETFGKIPQKRVQYLTYRGISITAVPDSNGYIYKAAQYGVSASIQRSIHLKLNSILFQKTTSIRNSTLESIYANADTDRDGYLTWKEIKGFQKMLSKRYSYRHNTHALMPDEFIAQGGGDCEDWALMTCGLLRYWGWTSYVASFFPPGSGDGHAICVVRWQDMPFGFGYYYIENGITLDGAAIKRGYYVPIDYEIVGGNSTAMKKSWRLKYFYTPEEIYGMIM